MKVYLAATNSGLTKADREIFIKEGKPRYILTTFFEGEKNCQKNLNEVGRDCFLLDSGAFSFMSGQECTKASIEEYAERYINFIKANKVKQYFEIDVDTIFGIDFVEKIRAKIERETGVPSIPVWHKGRGIDYFKRMVAEYQYVAIGGLVFHVKKSELPIIKRMARYAANRGVKCHGLGFTKTRELSEWDWYSVDSATWNLGACRGNQMHTFNKVKGCIETRKIEGNGMKVNQRKLVLHNGLEWCKYQRYMDTGGNNVK